VHIFKEILQDVDFFKTVVLNSKTQTFDLKAKMMKMKEKEKTEFDLLYFPFNPILVEDLLKQDMSEAVFDYCCERIFDFKKKGR